MQNRAPQTDYDALAARIKAWGNALGFQAVGISDTHLDAAEAHLLQWLSDGHHGAMDYMAKHGAKRARPAELVPGTLRVISVRMDYYPLHAKDTQEVLADGSRAFISRYALGRDYHKVLRNRLEKLAQQIRDAVECQCRVFTDSAPRAGSGAGAKGASGLARQAHAAAVARAGFMVLSGRDIHRSCRLPSRMRLQRVTRTITAAPATPASICAPRKPSPRHTSSMRGAASPTSPSSSKAASLSSCARSSATASTAATTASWSARGTVSRKKSIEPDFAVRNGLG